MSDPAHRRLARHLDALPGGFPPSETGADIKLLQRLFTPEEAELATHLTLEQEEARAIAERAGLPPSRLNDTWRIISQAQARAQALAPQN